MQKQKIIAFLSSPRSLFLFFPNNPEKIKESKIIQSIFHALEKTTFKETTDIQEKILLMIGERAIPQTLSKAFLKRIQKALNFIEGNEEINIDEIQKLIAQKKVVEAPEEGWKEMETPTEEEFPTPTEETSETESLEEGWEEIETPTPTKTAPKQDKK